MNAYDFNVMSIQLDIIKLWKSTILPHNNHLCKEYIDYIDWCGCLGSTRCLKCVTNYNGWYLVIKKGDNLNNIYQIISDIVDVDTR